MIRSFKDVGTTAIFYGENTSAARRTCPPSLWKVASRKLDQLDSVSTLEELRVPPGNRLEALFGIALGNTASAATDNTVSALFGLS